MKALIKVGYGCNEHCTFCHTLDVRHIDGASDEVLAKIERAKRLGHTMVVLSGGEPTIRPELFTWAERIAALDMDVGLVTNGLVLAYRDVVDRLVASRLRYVYLSLHGGTAKVHNSLVRSDAFDHAIAALANLSGRGIDLSVNCVITRNNVDHLRELVDAVLPFPDVALKLSMVEPKGGGDHLFDHLMPRIAHVAERVADAIRYGIERTGGDAGHRFGHGAIPLCLLPGLEDRFSDLKTHDYATMIEVGEPDYFPVDDLNKVQPEETCRGCALSGPCPGLYKGYNDVHGSSELRPVHDRPRSNSFNYVLETLVSTTADPGRCPLRDDGEGVTPWDRGRTLFVRNGERIARYRCTSRDFSDVELEHAKLALGQVYFDVSRKPAPDDFARDLAKLRRSDLCTGCPERERCTGLFEPVLEDVFTPDDARVRGVLGALTGDVLDVGCGDGPYEDILASLATAGTIRYTGIDPDAARIGALRVRWPWARLEARDAESLGPDAAARFDHVLVLRSWNHVREPRRVLGSLASALRPGGTLTVVDNVAFGLARTRPQTARAERGPARFEHHRNDEAADLVRYALGLPFAVRERIEVGPSTSNQWLVRLERA